MVIKRQWTIQSSLSRTFDKNDIEDVFKNESFDAVIHFAALALAGGEMQNHLSIITAILTAG